MSTNRELMECLAKARYLSKRINDPNGVRYDGSSTSIETDIQALAAEYFVCNHYRVPFNSTISNKGDGGRDFTFSLTVDVVHLGIKKDGTPRREGHLIINPEEPNRWSDIYVVVSGSIEEGFKLEGWISHRKLISYPKKDFGYGLKFAVNVSELHKMDLMNLKKD